MGCTGRGTAGGERICVGKLRRGDRVHFVPAPALCGAALLCMASTWLPGGYTVPEWLVAGLFVAVFPVLLVELVRCLVNGVGAGPGGRDRARVLVGYVRLLSPAVKLTYALVIGSCVPGFATSAGVAGDGQADASGHYYTYWNRSVQPQRTSRVELSEPEYRAAPRSELRGLGVYPALFGAFSSFLVLCSASAAVGRVRSVSRRSSGAATQREPFPPDRGASRTP